MKGVEVFILVVGVVLFLVLIYLLTLNSLKEGIAMPDTSALVCTDGAENVYYSCLGAGTMSPLECKSELVKNTVWCDAVST